MAVEGALELPGGKYCAPRVASNCRTGLLFRGPFSVALRERCSRGRRGALFAAQGGGRAAAAMALVSSSLALSKLVCSPATASVSVASRRANGAGQQRVGAVGRGEMATFRPLAVRVSSAGFSLPSAVLSHARGENKVGASFLGKNGKFPG